MEIMRPLLILALLFACDSDEAASEPDAFVHNPPEGDVYTAGMARAGADGALSVRLVDALPAPPDRGDNRWVIQIEAGDTMLTDCALTVEPDMPLHGHGTTPVEISEMGDGQYKLEAMNLFMPGLWIIPIQATCGEVTDTVTYEFWMEG